MLGLALGLTVGIPVGAALGRRWKDRRARFSTAYHAEISEQFRVHAEAVAGQVTEFADQLAAGDPVLRERLRQFEAGARS